MDTESKLTGMYSQRVSKQCVFFISVLVVNDGGDFFSMPEYTAC